MSIRKREVKRIPGIDADIIEKIRWAEDTSSYRDLFLDRETEQLLEALEAAADESLKTMKKKGVSMYCVECGDLSCCGEGIEKRFDVITLLINLLLGVKLQDRREIEGGCLFLKNDGCSLRVKEVICLNYLCRKICEGLSSEELIEVQEVCGREMDLLFMLSECLKRNIKKFTESRRVYEHNTE